MIRTDDPHPFIHRMRASGLPDTVIRERLLLEGWSPEIIDPIFAARAGSRSTPAESQPSPRHMVAPARKPRSHLLTFVVFTIFFSLAALGSAVYMYFKPPIVYSISLPSSSAASSAVPALLYGALAALSDSNYYEIVKRQLIDEKADFIDANLTTMHLSVYKSGVEALSVPILGKGRTGSWWETPAGIYKVQAKEKNHFSSFGNVYQPWSINFQGNFYIHGWPYYPDGTPVSSTYSGGCIRLSTADAEAVYALSSVGMPVLVHETSAPSDSFSYELKAPPVSASAYLVADLKNGTVLSSKSADVAAPIASISKLVTALVATEYINLDKIITVPENALVYTSIPRLRAREKVRAYDLLFLLLQESSNEAAETLASAPGRAQFIDFMNEKARAINLSKTVFSDPSGAKGDYATPEDLFTLLRYIDGNRRFVFGITAGQLSGSAYGPPAFKNIRNFNLIPGSPAKLVGGKIGMTNEAGETYAGIFSAQIGNEERDIAVIVLDSLDAARDVRELLSFVLEAYATGAD
ncbi:MAG: Serine-type D-Ala-D-Ala carboxypeptidase [Parcubacteria group bacterium GW2011_GWA2_51_10]|nr:MAG: Serine-type D-Ala-D-Ala carboxypeptidase [Parcubacteria group bacterium GW2011_GWA2_51_10]